MATIGRRKFIITGGAATFGLSLATLVTRNRAQALGFGELIPDPQGFLDLPAGFSYTVLEEKGDPMDDGYRVPGRPDGMACFSGPNDTLILMRNHEVSLGDGSNGPYSGDQNPSAKAYDPEGMGGVTRVVVDATTFERISSNLVLIGTARNCCGGPSPWGWLSCEESTDINGSHRHGYTFLCPTNAQSVQTPQRIHGYGRYNHEGVAVDPSNHHAYLTEDRGDSCLYRFVPDSMAEPFVGKLQALKVIGEDEFETADMSEGDIVDIEWVDIDEPDLDSDTVRDEGHDKGAAVFARGEGICFFEGQVYICSTSGGPVGRGQVFRLIDGDSPTLELVVQSTGSGVLDKPDNITVAPWGELFMVEDGDNGNHVRWVTAEGEICNFAHNVGSSSEFAGICFSPDGKAMFLNIQSDHLTLVVTGPFPAVMNPGDGDGDATEETTEETTEEGGTTTGDGESTTDEGGTDEGDDGGHGTGKGKGTGNGTGNGTGHGTGKGGADPTDDDLGDPVIWPGEPGVDIDGDTGLGCAVAEPSGVGALVAGLATVVVGTLIPDSD